MAKKKKTKVRRGLKPRTQSDKIDYNERGDGPDTTSIPPGYKLINTELCKEHGIEIIRPNKSHPPVVFRPWPSLDYDDPMENLSPGRTPEGMLQQVKWMQAVPAVKYAGLNAPEGADLSQPATWRKYPKLTWALHLPGEENRKRAWEENPYMVFYSAHKAAYTAYKKGAPLTDASGQPTWNPVWASYMNGGQGRGPEISSPSNVCLVQGAVYTAKGTNYVFNPEEDVDRSTPYGNAEGDPLVIIELSRAFRANLITLLDRQRKEGTYEESDENPSAPYVYGDPVGTYDSATGTIKKGLIIVAYMSGGMLQGLTKRERDQVTKHTDWDGKKEEDFAPYHASVMSSYEVSGTKFTPSMNAEETEQVFEKWQFWWDDPVEGEPGLIPIYSMEEQAVFVAQAYKHDPDLLRFGWADHPEFETDEVSAILNNRTVVAVEEASTTSEEVTSEAEDDEDDEFTSDASEHLDTEDEDEDEEFPDDVEGSELEEEDDAEEEEDEDDEDEFPDVDLASSKEEDEDGAPFEEDEEDEVDPDEVASDREAEMQKSMSAAKKRSKRRASPRNNPPAKTQ